MQHYLLRRIVKAQEKVEEANYFLKGMEQDIQDRPKFRHNLSAFLSAARSVTWVLQAELSGSSKFDQWYANQQEKMKEDPIISFFKEKRSYTVKQAQVPVKGKINVHIKETLTPRDSWRVVVKSSDGKVVRTLSSEDTRPQVSQKPAKQTTVSYGYKWYFEDNPDIDVITLSHQYLDKLSAIVHQAKLIVS